MSTINIGLTKDQFESMMFITNGKKFIENAKDIEPYWQFFGDIPTVYGNNISIQFYRLK